MTEDRAALSTADINNLADSDFAYIQPGGSKDSSGRTVPRSLRHFPIHDAAHVRNALARIGQGAAFGKEAMPAVMRAAKRFGIDTGMNSRPHLGTCVRAFDFEADAPSNDGRTLEGYVAVFNTRARIRDSYGDFDEEIMPGAFRASLERQTPVMQFEHGLDPRVGKVPIGAIQHISEDSKGLHVRARLFDNATVEPVRQAIEGGAIKGMSFRFQVPDGGDTWERRYNDVDLRSIRETAISEGGPVVFPAYDATTVSVRSLLAQLDPDEHRSLVRELAAELRLAVDLQDLTGRPAQGAGGGDPGAEPEPSTTPALSNRLRLEHEALRLRGILK